MRQIQQLKVKGNINVTCYVHEDFFKDVIFLFFLKKEKKIFISTPKYNVQWKQDKSKASCPDHSHMGESYQRHAFLLLSLLDFFILFRVHGHTNMHLVWRYCDDLFTYRLSLCVRFFAFSVKSKR